MAENSQPEKGPEADVAEFAAFLESSPPGSIVPVRKIRVFNKGSGRYYLASPDIQLHCDADTGGGTRFFNSAAGEFSSISDSWSTTFQTYTCRNCRTTRKVFAIMYRHTTGEDGQVYKLGELPPFGPPIPSRVISMIGPDRELFIRGKRAENQGLGIGAFAYYRRVLENQWSRIPAQRPYAVDTVRLAGGSPAPGLGSAPG